MESKDLDCHKSTQSRMFSLQRKWFKWDFDILICILLKGFKVPKQACQHLHRESNFQQQFDGKSLQDVRCFIMPAEMIALILNLYSVTIAAITCCQKSKNVLGANLFYSNLAEVHYSSTNDSSSADFLVIMISVTSLIVYMII